MRASHLKRPLPSPVSPEVLDRAETIPEALAELARRHPDHECLTILDRHWKEWRTTHAALWRAASAAARAMQGHGLRPGGEVVLVFPTGPELVAGYFGAMLAGGIPAILSTPSNRMADSRMYREHVGQILQTASASVLYCEDRVADIFEAAGPDVLGSTSILRPGQVCASDVLSERIAVAPSDVATIQYSSGSTGNPKGVLLEHRAMLNHVRSLREGLEITPADVSVNWIPLYHDMGLIDAFLLPLLAGCPTVMIPTMDFLREPSLWLWGIHGYGGTISWSPNFGYAFCARRLEGSDIEGLDLSSWRLAMSAAEPVLAETIAAFERKFRPLGFADTAMTPSWGLAESCVIVTSHAPDERARMESLSRDALVRENRALRVPPDAENAITVVSVGRSLPRARFEIRDDDRKPLPERQVGEVWIETDCLFRGYKDEPELTAQTLVDGWFDTGDRGYEAEGDLYFVSRSKDLIVIGGENYAPHDVETAINRVPGVREGCAVAFGVMNEKRGTEELCAVVEVVEDDPERRVELADQIRGEVAREVGLGIRHLHLVPPGGINKTTSGKLARRSTRDRYPEVFGARNRDRG